MNIKLSKPFAANFAVDEFDVKQMKKALNRLGYYQPYEKVGITGIPDAGVFAALKAFQKEHGLPATGAAKPDDKTLQALNAALSTAPDGQYIWRTVGDDKVRGSHAALNGTLRRWSDSPDPTEDYNCRCWAEAFKGLNLETLKEIPTGLQQELIASVGDAPEKWNNLQFLWHFAFGGGRTLKLAEIGYLGEVIEKTRQRVFPSLEDQISTKMRKIKSGPLTYSTKNSYFFGDVHPYFGGGTIYTRVSGIVTLSDGMLSIQGKIQYEYKDTFTDPTNIRQRKLGTSALEKSRMIAQNHGGITKILRPVP